MASKECGTLFVVAVPIGNPEDITLRALKTLQDADCVAAEDTREFKKLAAVHAIDAARVVSYREHNEPESAEGLLKMLDQGLDVALVTDAGTPGISDPGYRVVHLAFEKDYPVVVIPGVSSLTAALSVCPLGGVDHYFAGFLQPKKLKNELEKIKNSASRIVLFEAPHRLVEHLQEAQEVLGDVLVFICRELTKSHEEFFYGSLSKALEKFTVQKPMGEFVIVYKAPTKEEADESLDDWLEKELSNGKSPRDLLKEAQKVSKLSRRDLFQKIQDLKERLSEDE